MDRREAIAKVSLILGGSVMGAGFFIAGCNPAAKNFNLLFTNDNVLLFSEIGETILPATSTPGAKAANIGEFIALMVQDCYTAVDTKIFIEGIANLNDRCDKKFGKKFLDIDSKQRNDVLNTLDKEQKEYSNNKKPEDPNHYFRMFMELTLLGFFTSEIGATKALRYIAVPGKYDGNLTYKKGDRAWAT